ncbi:MAG: hypothetical protein ABI402_02080 [Ferruginibacter sp.]
MKTSKLLIASSFFIFVLFLFSCSKTKQQDTVVNSPQSEEFVNFTIDGVDTSYAVPSDNMIYHGGTGTGTENGSFFASVGVTAMHYYGTDSNYVFFDFPKAGIAAGSSQQLDKIIQTGLHPLFSASSPQYVHITEYGNIGEYVAGNFNGSLVDQPGISHIVHFDFRIKRSN